VREGQYRTDIPATYTASNYPLQYFFELTPEVGGAQYYPGFAANHANQPDFVVRAAPGRST
jgi:hypothetical protein